jgi:hypothetical protein
VTSNSDSQHWKQPEIYRNAIIPHGHRSNDPENMMQKPELRLRKLERRASLSVPTHAIIKYDPDKPGDLEGKRAEIQARYSGIPLGILPTLRETVEEWQAWVNREEAKRKSERDLC